jgi:RNA polymerase sigma factor (sigma-70 family)
MMNGTNLRDETQCSSVFSVGGDWGVGMVSTTVTKRAEQRGTSLEELYARHAPAAVRLAFLMTSDRELSRDIAQDAFIRVAGRFRQLRFPDMFDAYLRKTVVNLCLSHFRHERVERDYLAGRSAETEPVVESPDLGTRDELRRALQRLPVRQRTAIVLRYYEDLTEEQVAAAMRCSVLAARSLVSRGMESLRTIVRSEER